MNYTKILVLMLLSTALCAQVPSAFTYQGLLLDVSGQGIQNKTATFDIAISSDASGNQVYYSEQQDVVTDENGVFQFNIGDGSVMNGAMDDIDWLGGVPYINVTYDLNNGGGEVSLGSQQFSAVPFCFSSRHIVCMDGLPGEDGRQGPQGATGPQGWTGAQGATGIQGNPGSDGLGGIPNMTMSSLAPSIALEGDIYLDNGTNRADGNPGFMYYDGSTWIEL